VIAPSCFSNQLRLALVRRDLRVISAPGSRRYLRLPEQSNPLIRLSLESGPSHTIKWNCSIIRESAFSHHEMYASPPERLKEYLSANPIGHRLQ
jgi:hypothetical protein